jgi:hypothetical protein
MGAQVLEQLQGKVALPDFRSSISANLVDLIAHAIVGDYYLTRLITTLIPRVS